MLRVLNSIFRVIDSFVLLSVYSCMESKLHFVKSASEAKEGHVCSLDHANNFLISTCRGFRVVGGDGHKWLKSFNRIESLKV